MAKARYVDKILLVLICRSLCIRSSGMLALLSQMSQSLSMGTCILASMWVQIRGCLRVCDVHVCVCCVLYLPPSEALITALQQVLSSGGSRARGGFAPNSKISPREAPQFPLNFTCLFAYHL